MAINSYLNIYLFKQLISLFLFTVGLLSAIGVAIGTLSELAYQISNYNLPLIVAIKIFVLKIPEYVAYGLPLATLLTTLIVYGRLNRECEIIAFQSVGISLYKIILPAIYLSIVVTFMTFIANEFIVPKANYQVSVLQDKFLPEAQLNLQQKDIFYPEYSTNDTPIKHLKRLYYANNFDGKKLNSVIVLSWQSDRLKQIIIANKAYWNQQLQLWEMYQGTVENLSNDILTTVQTNFDHYQAILPATIFKIAQQKSDPYAMSLAEARNYLQLITDSGNVAKTRLFKVRIQQKLAFPFICIIFALIGSAIGVTSSNLKRGKSFGYCVAIAFGYYLLGFIIGSLGIAGALNSIIAGWLPNFIGLGCGLWLLMSNKVKG